MAATTERFGKARRASSEDAPKRADSPRARRASGVFNLFARAGRKRASNRKRSPRELRVQAALRVGAISGISRSLPIIQFPRLLPYPPGSARHGRILRRRDPARVNANLPSALMLGATPRPTFPLNFSRMEAAYVA